MPKILTFLDVFVIIKTMTFLSTKCTVGANGLSAPECRINKKLKSKLRALDLRSNFDFNFFMNTSLKGEQAVRPYIYEYL